MPFDFEVSFHTLKGRLGTNETYRSPWVTLCIHKVAFQSVSQGFAMFPWKSNATLAHVFPALRRNCGTQACLTPSGVRDRRRRWRRRGSIVQKPAKRGANIVRCFVREPWERISMYIFIYCMYMYRSIHIVYGRLDCWVRSSILNETRQFTRVHVCSW